MALEYPKFLPKLNEDGSEDDENGVTVHDAREEATAVAKGFKARPSAAKGQQHAELKPIVQLDYPKRVYKGVGEARESKVVKNADEEAAAAEDGFAAVEAPAEGEVHGADWIATDVAEEPAKEPDAPKAPKAPKAEKPKGRKKAEQ